MESLNKLIQTLQTMIDAHSRLLDLAKEKRGILVNGNAQELQSLIIRESSIVDEIQKLELIRKQFVQTYMFQIGQTGQSFTIEEVVHLQDDPQTKATLNRIAKQLRILIQEISYLNETNQQLIQTSLSYIQYSFGMYVPKEQSIGYGPNSAKRYSNLLDAKV